jgi:hypothetical protein
MNASGTDTNEARQYRPRPDLFEEAAERKDTRQP